MGYTYAQIRKLQSDYGMDHLSTNEFASMMNQTTGSKAFDAGVGGFGNALKAYSYGVDQALNYTHLPQDLGQIGQAAFGDVGKDVFSSIPRTAVDLAPSLIPGVGPAVATAANFGINTYEKTDSPLAGVTSAALFPLIGAGGRLGSAAVNRITNPALTEALAGSSLGLLRGGAATAGVKAGTATSLAEGGQIVNPLARAASYLGGKAGETLGLATQSGVIGAETATSGQRWDAFGQAFKPSHLAADALSLAPFLLKDAAGRITGGPGKAAAETNFLSDYDNTLGKYNEARWNPIRDTTGQLANEVLNRTNQLALPEFSPNAAQFNQQGQVETGMQKMTEADLLNQNVADVNKKTVRMTDVKGKPTDIRPSTLPLQDGVLRQPTLEEQVKTTWTQTPDPAKLEILSTAEPAVKLDSALLENGSTREEARTQTENLVNKGIPLDDAANEVAQREVQRATDRVQKRTVRQTREDATAGERNQWLEQWMATAPDDQKQAFQDALKNVSGTQTKIKDRSTTALTNALRSWVADTNGQGGVASLQKKLSQEIAFTQKKGRDLKTRTPVGESNGETYTVADGKKIPIGKYTDQAQAKLVRDQLASNHSNFAWIVDSAGKGKWQILRYEHEQTSGQGTEEGRNLTDEDMTAALNQTKTDSEPITQLEKDATRSEQQDAIEAVTQTHQDSFVDNIPADDLTELGDGDAQKGQARVEHVLSLVDEGKVGPKTIGAELTKSGLFRSDQEVTGFLGNVKELLMDYVRGKAKAFGSVSEDTTGQLTTLGQMLKNAGLGNPEHLAEAARLMSLFDHPDIAFGSLKSGQPAQGLFTQTTDGQKAVWLAAGLGPDRAAFVLAHELNGHGLWSLLEQGKLDQESSNRMRRYANFVGENTPEQNKAILREVLGMLPDRFKKDAGLATLVEATHDNPEEVLANINAAVSLAMVNAKPSAWKSFMEWMPKPISDFIATSAKYGRKFFEAISGVSFLRNRGILPERLNDTNQSQLHSYLDSLYKVLRYDGQRAEQARDAARLDIAMTPGMEMGALLDGSIFQHPESEEGGMLVKPFWGMLSKDKRNENLYQRIGVRGWNKWFNPLVVVGQQFPKLLRITTRGQNREAVNNRLENEVFRPLGLKNNGIQIVADKEGVVPQVARDPNLREFRNRLQQRAQVMGKSVQELIDGGDQATKNILAKMNVGDQQKVREAIGRQMDSNLAQTKIYEDQSVERAVYKTGEAMMVKDLSLTEDQARAQAQAIVDNVRAGKNPFEGKSVPPSEAEMLGVDFSGKLLDRINQNLQVMKDNPHYITSRRMGDFKFRVVYKDPTQNTVIDAHSYGEQTQKMGELQKTKGDQIVDMIPLPLTKGSFDFNQASIDFLTEQERGMREQLQQVLQANGIDSDTAQDIAGKYSAVADLRKELAAKAIPSISLKRNFKEGWEDQDMLDQQVQYNRIMLRSLTKGTADAEVKMMLRDPTIRDHPDKEAIERGWELYKTPDPASVRAIGKFNYIKFLSFHFLNMLQDASYAWTGILAPLMIADGGGVVSSYARVTAAAARLGKEMLGTKLPPDQQAMIDKYRAGNKGVGTYSDEANLEALTYHNANRVADGKDPLTMGQLLTKPLGQLLIWSKGLHKKFTDFSAETSMLAAYDHFLKNGKMSPADADSAAFDLVTSTIGGGKAGRAVGVWDSGKLKPLSASLMALQTFGFLQIGTWKGFADKALGQIPGLTKTERINASKAFGAHSAAMFATAGVFGLPLVGVILATIDKLFGVNSKEAVASWLQSDTSEDHSVQQIALHGLINQFGGVDYASRGNVPGVLGLNPEQGFSLDSLAGPTWSLLKDMFGSATSLAHGRVGEAATHLAPNNIKRGLQLWRDDWEFRKKDGRPYDQADAFDKGLYTVMGLKPQRIASMQERDQWQRVDAEIDKTERRNWLDGVVETMNTQGPEAVKEAIQQRVKDRPGENVNALSNAVVERVLDKTLPYDPRRQAGSSQRVNQTSNAPLPSYTEQQRLSIGQQLLQTLQIGKPASPSRWQSAAAVDQLRAVNPYLSYDEAIKIIEAEKGGGGGLGGRSGLSGGGLGRLGLGGIGGL